MDYAVVISIASRCSAYQATARGSILGFCVHLQLDGQLDGH